MLIRGGGKYLFIRMDTGESPCEFYGATVNGNLKRQFQFFLEHQDELVEKYNGKVVVIYDEAVDGVFDSELDALASAQKKHERGTFLVQKVTPGSESYTQVFHSRVAFA